MMRRSVIRSALGLRSKTTTTTTTANATCDILKRVEKHRNNAFKLFGIEQRFEINENKLKREMLNLQTILHPDKFVDKDTQSQAMSSNFSALVNESYDILSNPYERGKYLLSLVTKKSLAEIEEDLDKLRMDGDFLKGMMDLREKIEDLSLDGMELSKLSSSLESELTKLVRMISQDFEANNIESVLSKLGKLKFVINCYRVVADRCDSFSKF